MTVLGPSARRALLLLSALFVASLPPRASAVLLPFDSCTSFAKQNPSQSGEPLQYKPLYLDVVYDAASQPHSLNVTVFGNVTGQTLSGSLPPPSDSYWSNPNATNGKITDVGTSGNLTSLSTRYDVLSFTVANNLVRFCGALRDNGSCPLGPTFFANTSTPESTRAGLPAVVQSLNLNSSYAFTTLSTTVQVFSGDTGLGLISCVSAQITPALGPRIENLLTWLPAAILIIKGLATLSAAIWSPWGSADIFRWSSNYGRDEDLLRLVTPGFGDCLQYIQFVVLTGALTLNYPGFFQPAVSQASWSVLLFNESFVSQGPGTQSLVDGVYRVNGTYGMARMSQYIGMETVNDIWACMAIWLLVIAAAVVVLTQLGFFGRWIYRQVTSTSEEDLRKKNLPFTLGNMIRLVFNYFILPIVALSLFQLVIAFGAPASVLACAAVLLVLVIISAGWILRVIFKTKPRTLLFDDMPTVLLYGPLYNTYNDSAAPFALIPVFITFMRAVAIGAVQPSGIAQIIVLAICEVILILTLNGFRPFQGQTSMNLYHTCFASIRLITVLLMIAFVPSLSVSQAPKGWIGYVILILHACVLVFGFFLNSAQTLVEVLARALGAGGDSHSGAIRGSILNWRMLKKRQTRVDAKNRASTMSTTAMLQDSNLDVMSNGRSRSISASSQQLLGRTSGFDNFSSGGDPLASPDPESENASAFGMMLGGRPSIGSRDHHPGDNYYRAPRPRKATLGALSEPGNKTRGSVAEFPYRDAPGQGQLAHTRDNSYEPNSGHDSPAPAYIRERQGSNGELQGSSNAGASAPRTDYAVREVDQYYRGAALNDQPTRKLKTGPADPEGPAIVAQSWFQNFLFAIGSGGAKKKEQGKGFEVVRSSRMPPEELERDAAAAGLRPTGEDLELQDTPTMKQQPYFDSPTKATGTTTTSIAPDELVQEGTTKHSSNAGLATSADGDSHPDGEEEEEEEVILGTATRASRHYPSQVFDFGFDGTRSRTSAGGQSPLLNHRPESETLPQPALIPFRASQGMLGAAITSSGTDRASSHYPEDDDDEVHFTPVDAETPPLPHHATTRDLVAGLDLPPHPLSMSTSHQQLQQHPQPRPTIDLHPSAAPAPQPPVRSPKRNSALNRTMPNPPSTTTTSAAANQSPGGGGAAAPTPDIADSPSAQAWLAAVDALDRNPHALSRSSTLASSRHDAAGGSSSAAAAAPAAPAMPPSPADRGGPVPSSVQRHRAADSISRNSLGAQVALQASQAEIFEAGEDGDGDAYAYEAGEPVAAAAGRERSTR
jgi:hypothetical protein